MKSTELRIGNYYDNNGETCVVSPNTILEVWEAERTWVKPILLTECLLLNFSFDKMGIKFVKNGIIVWEEENNFIFALNSNDGSEIRVKLLYVHQLQNLYFALTGKELEL